MGIGQGWREAWKGAEWEGDIELGEGPGAKIVVVLVKGMHVP
jgi:hypothetical protein